MRIIRNIAGRKGLEENERKAIAAAQTKKIEEVDHGIVEPEPAPAAEVAETVEAVETNEPAKKAPAKKSRKKAKASV